MNNKRSNKNKKYTYKPRIDDIKNNNKDRPKIISGITKGEELKKIKKGLAGIFDILVNEKPIITPIIVAKVADKEAIFILV